MNTAIQKKLKISGESFTVGMKPDEKSFVLAVKDFSENLRSEFTGDPLVLTHDESIQSVNILSDLGMDSFSLAAGFLHDLYRFPVVMDKIRKEFGNELCSLVEEYGTISMLAKKAKKGESEEDYIRMVLTVANDFRAILMLIANRYLRLLNRKKLIPSRQKKQAERALSFYAPLAHRLGLFKYKIVLEDMALEVLHPEIFADISSRISKKKYRFDRYLNKVILKLQYELKKHRLSPEITGRSKHVTSIYRKMQRTGRPFDQIFDVLAVRAVVKSVPDCYKVLAVAQQIFNPILEEFDDYIQKPKINGYQSLHLLLEDRNSEESKFELQIRTEEMHKTSEIGIAAHWAYKEGGKKSRTDSFFEWFREHATKSGTGFADKAFENFFNLQEFKNDIFVLTPKGELKKLPKGATPIDFAFSIHKDIGIRCTGAKVNGAIVPFDRALNNGDRVEIMTSNQPMINADWIKYAKSSRALAEIRKWIRNQTRLLSIKLGEEIFIRALRKVKVAITNELLNEICKTYPFDSIDDLYYAVGSGKHAAQAVIKKILKPEEKEEQHEETIEQRISSGRKNPMGIKVGGMDSFMVHFGKCCLPIPGDTIMGYITRGKGVTVHRNTCKNIRHLQKEPEREIEVDWEQEADRTYVAGVKVSLVKQDDFIKNITPVFGKQKVNLLNYQISNNMSDEYSCILVVELSSTKELEQLINTFKSMKSVGNVIRMHYSEFNSLLKSAPVALG
ncbi:bifunctional (p)ppGpp synthetase/guanosine-3',5'-bis(diphosphate) 3'-pyrophosphohydrolase [candidate division KSB1 bacterium]|nr:bifunctional (p)ppGpp synthetase/guanosine-3',5'-bis(diphosphate) 3'-pyrophosphohydrolase [candidate division KSB1 bacterium]